MVRRFGTGSTYVVFDGYDARKSATHNNLECWYFMSIAFYSSFLFFKDSVFWFHGFFNSASYSFALSSLNTWTGGISFELRDSEAQGLLDVLVFFKCFWAAVLWCFYPCPLYIKNKTLAYALFFIKTKPKKSKPRPPTSKPLDSKNSASEESQRSKDSRCCSRVFQKSGSLFLKKSLS